MTAPTPSPAAGYLPRRAAAGQKSELRNADVDEVTTASTREQTRPARQENGWVIQIGASPNEKMANDLLQDAQEKGGKVLRSAKPFTIAFNSNGAQMYRARFGGFDDQKAAVDACTTLKKRGISCWASLQ